MELWQQQAAFAEDVAKLINYINQSGMHCTFGDAYRTPAQADEYAKTGIGIKDSLHCKRLAIDLNLFDGNGQYESSDGLYEKFGIYWERLDPLNKWGGRFKRQDGNHFQRNQA